MKVLNQIELYLQGSYSKEERKTFLFKSRCVCSFWERKIGKLKFLTQYSRINVYLTDADRDEIVRPMEKEPFLEVYLNLSLEEGALECDESMLRLYISIIKRALLKASTLMPIPMEESEKILCDFDKGGLKNEWIQADKSWKNGFLKSQVIAKLSTQEFSLVQSVFIEDTLVGQTTVITTQPRELLFSNYLGKLFLTRDGNLIYKKGRKILSEFDVENQKFLFIVESKET